MKLDLNFVGIPVASIVVLLSSPSFGDASLTAALAKAYENSHQLEVARANLRSLDEGVVVAQSAKRPTASGTVTHERSQFYTRQTSFSGTTTRFSDFNERTSVTISAQQLISDFGRSDLTLASAEMRVKAGRQSLMDLEQGVLLNAVIAYMDVRRASNVVALTQSNVRVLQEQQKAAQDRYDVGELTKTDVSQTEARLAIAVGDLERAKGDFAVAREAYASITGSYPSDTPMPKERITLPESADAAEKLAIQNHPRMLEAQFTQALAQFDLNAAEKNRLPTISASLNLAAQSNTNNNSNPARSMSVGVTASVPIYQGGRLDSEVRRARIELGRAQANLQLVSVQTKQSVRSAYADWVAAKTAITASQQQIESAEVAYEGVREEASLGARTTLDVLDAEQEVLSARSRLIAAERNVVVARYGLLSEIGALTAAKLGLSVNLYDAEKNYKAVTETKLGMKRDKIFNKLSEKWSR